MVLSLKIRSSQEEGSRAEDVGQAIQIPDREDEKTTEQKFRLALTNEAKTATLPAQSNA